MQLTISLHIIIPNGTIKGSGIGSLFQSKVSRKRQDLSAGANGSVECLTTIIETRRDGIENESIDYLDLTGKGRLTFFPEKAMKCPHCGLLNPVDAIRCDCGYDF